VPWCPVIKFYRDEIRRARRGEARHGREREYGKDSSKFLTRVESETVLIAIE